MTSKRSLFLLLTLAALLTPGLAAAGPAPAAPLATPVADLDLAWLSEPEAGAVPALASPGLEGAVALATGIDYCAAKLRKCRQDCWDTGIFSFTCNAATMQSSCICN
jgi:hypothetical protein